MYRKIRKRLTILNGSIVTMIFIIMSLGYLSISEKNLKENKLKTYENDVRSIASTLENQIIISNSWLTEISSNGNYVLSVLDNGYEFLFNKRNNDKTDKLIRELWKEYRMQQDYLERTVISYDNYYKKFLSNNGLCYVLTYGEKESLEVMIFCSYEHIQRQILQQREVFISIIVASLILIWIFSWFFIGKLLKPIELSQIRQNNFVAAASHELRTPLAVIISCIEDLQGSINSKNDDSSLTNIDVTKAENDFQSNYRINEVLDIVKNESFRMSNLLSDMLTLSSKDSGHFDLDKKEVELDTLLLNVYESFEPMLKSKNISCRLELPEEPIVRFECDKGKIHQLMAILLHNAINYTPEKGQIDIRLIEKKDKKRHTSYLIQVQDNGPGISDEDKAKVFDRFYRSESARSSKGHFGLGLAIAKEIVTAHGGYIEVTDTFVTSKTGATFNVYL